MVADGQCLLLAGSCLHTAGSWWAQRRLWQPRVLWVSVSRRALVRGGPAVVGKQEPLALCVLQDGGVTEVILLGGLDAEGALGPHAQHRLVDVECAHILQL